MKINYLNFGDAFVKISGLCILLFFITPPVQAEKITIGKGSGVVWEGLPFNVSLSYLVTSDVAYPYHGILAIANYENFNDRNCSRGTDLYKVNQYTTFELADGVGLIPRAAGEARFRDSSGVEQLVTGTIGLPSTRGLRNGFLINVPFTNGGVSYDYCIPIKSFSSSEGPLSNAFRKNSIVRVSISGGWVIVANGSQRPQDNIIIDPIHATSMAASSSDYKIIFPANFDLRVSTLSCTVDTPVNINFGVVGRNKLPDVELARVSNELYVSCSQESTIFPVKANINVQFRPISDLYNGAVNKLALNEKGGYITGTIPGVTSTGLCGTDDGITFDNKQIKLGAIEENELHTMFHHRLDWRLCSGGASLPSGKVTASTEMLVTYN